MSFVGVAGELELDGLSSLGRDMEGKERKGEWWGIMIEFSTHNRLPDRRWI